MPVRQRICSITAEKKKLLCSLLCLIFLTLPVSVGYAEDIPEEEPFFLEAENRQPCVKGIPAALSGKVARGLAYLQILQQAAAMLGDDLAARLWGVQMQDTQNLQQERIAALASALFAVHYTERHLPREKTDRAEIEGWTEVSASASASLPELAAGIRRLLKDTDNLDLRLAALQHMQQAAEEGKAILERNIGKTAAFENPFAVRADLLGRRLAALEGYLDAMRDFDQMWKFPETASAIMKHLCELDPYNAILWTGLGEALLLAGYPYQALEAFGKASRQTEKMPERAFYLRGIAYLRLHLPASAERDFSQALPEHADNAELWYARGAARLLKNEYDAMCSDFYKACALGNCEGLAEVRKKSWCAPHPIPDDSGFSPRNSALCESSKNGGICELNHSGCGAVSAQLTHPSAEQSTELWETGIYPSAQAWTPIH